MSRQNQTAQIVEQRVKEDSPMLPSLQDVGVEKRQLPEAH
jgi:hypothetical protein